MPLIIQHPAKQRIMTEPRNHESTNITDVTAAFRELPREHSIDTM